MKKLVAAIVVTGALAFYFGYMFRGSLDRPLTDLETRTEIATSQDSQGRETVTATNTAKGDRSAPAASRPDPDATREVIEVTNRKTRKRIKRDRLADFFVINGIGEQRAEEIIKGLVEADYRLNQQQQALLDQHRAAKGEEIARGDVVAISLTPEERAAFDAERSSEYREVFGEYYEAYESYEESYIQRRVINDLSSGFAEPLDYTAKETLIQIMREEQSRLESAVYDRRATPDGQPSNVLQGWAAEKDRYYVRIGEMRTYNQRVLNRAKPYVSAEHLEQLQTLLENEIRKIELLIELEDLDQKPRVR